MPCNPGDGYWDVLALDVYGGDGYTLQKYQTLLQLARNKPIAIGECEVLPTADELAAQSRWTFFMAWAKLVSTGNSVQQIQALYNAANVITLNQMPPRRRIAVQVNLAFAPTMRLTMLNRSKVLRASLSMRVTITT